MQPTDNDPIPAPTASDDAGPVVTPLAASVPAELPAELPADPAVETDAATQGTEEEAEPEAPVSAAGPAETAEPAADPSGGEGEGAEGTEGTEGEAGAVVTEVVEVAEGAAPATEPASPAPVDLSPAQCSARLAALFPALFNLQQPKPLKLRIQADIQARAPGVFTRKSLSAFLHRYTTGTPYVLALTREAQRYDLDGEPAGELAAEHRDAAVTELARRRAIVETRRAAEQAARREADAAARQQRDADQQGRRERALLLRAFETSTLTRANFCALKGLADADLDGLLVQARQEAAERPAWTEPAGPGRGPAGPGPRRDDGRRNERDGRDGRDARPPRDPQAPRPAREPRKGEGGGRGGPRRPPRPGA